MSLLDASGLVNILFCCGSCCETSENDFTLKLLDVASCLSLSLLPVNLLSSVDIELVKRGKDCSNLLPHSEQNFGGRPLTVITEDEHEGHTTYIAVRSVICKENYISISWCYQEQLSKQYKSGKTKDILSCESVDDGITIHYICDYRIHKFLLHGTLIHSFITIAHAPA